MYQSQIFSLSCSKTVVILLKKLPESYSLSAKLLYMSTGFIHSHNFFFDRFNKPRISQYLDMLPYTDTNIFQCYPQVIWPIKFLFYWDRLHFYPISSAFLVATTEK